MEINEDKLFLLIKTMKEARSLMTGRDDNSIMKRHKVAIEIDLLNKILAAGDIEFLITKYDAYRINKTILKNINKMEEEQNGTTKKQ